MVLSPAAPTCVYVVGHDPLVTRTLSKLLDLDDQIEVLGEAANIGALPLARHRADVIVLTEASPSERMHQIGADIKVCMLDTLRGLTLGEVIDTVKRIAPSFEPGPLHVVPPPDRGALAALSDRELEVVGLVAEGLSNKEISSRLRLSDKTVKNHISHILAKMNLNARTQVAVYAIRAGFV
ncbi:MAG TPA: response regulator transcription factor [Candidatus Rubrimentiphilum sp.]|nr:response regulator transcription factor [Candidatus Rubrimentiphilum sp.]